MVPKKKKETLFSLIVIFVQMYGKSNVAEENIQGSK
jgi:hypothetical protein